MSSAHEIFSEDQVVYRYKYLPFSRGSIKIISEGTIKFTSPLEFNDPFDCKPYYDPEHMDQLIKKRPELWKEAGDRLGMSPGQRLLNKGKMLKKMQKRAQMDNFGEELLARIGIVSLSRTALNILMWSHYAEFHRGFVVEFRIPIEGKTQDQYLATDRLLPFPIEYSETRPTYQIGVEDHKDGLTKTLLSKSLDWEYEEEERAIDFDRGPGIFPYRRDDVLTSVIAGMKMPEDDIAELRDEIMKLRESKLPKLELYKAEGSRDKYQITIPGHPRAKIG